MKTKSFTNRSFAVLLATILLLVAIPVTSVLAVTSGPRYPGTTSGVSPWTNTNNIGADDTSYATYVIPTSGTSSAITGTNYGFTIPAGSTINGITVEIGRASSSAGGGNSINDATVRLLGGTVAGTNLATATGWPTSQGTASYGGATNTWGNTWTAAQINSSNFGVTLTAQNQSGFGTRTASVDFIRITVDYSSTATTTAVTSSVNPSTFGSPVTFTATVTSTSTPTGSVNFVVDGGSPVAGSVGTTTATTATWTYTTSALTGGSHTVQANYVHSNGFLDSNGSLSGGQTVNKAAQATLTAVATPGTVVYGSTAALSSTGGSGTGAVTFSAGASTGCSVAGTTLSVTNASGSCSITATKAADGNYLVATSAPLAVTLAKADTTTVVTGGTFPYDGAAHAASVSVTGPGGLNLTPAASYDGSCSAAPVTVAEGTTCTASYDYAGDNNYNASTDSDSITINTATQTALTVNDPSIVTYGSTAALSTTGGSGTGAVTFSAGASTGCSVSDTTLSVLDTSGSCAITATKAADGNYLEATSLPFTVTLAKADTTTTVTGGTFSYDGAAHAASVSVTGPGGLNQTPDASYSGSCSAAPVTVAEGTTCTASYDYAGDNNYLPSNDSDSITINTAPQAALVAVVTPDTVVFGSTAALSTTGGSSTGDVTFSAGASTGCSVTGATLSVTDASGSCSITATKAADDNYQEATSAPQTVTLAKAATTTTVTGGTFTFDGAAHAATVSVTGPGGLNQTPAASYSGSCSAAPVTVAEGTSCTASYSYPGDNNYIDSSDSATIVITAKLIPDLTASGGPFTYDGSPHAATVTSLVAGTVSNVQYDGTTSVPQNAGTYAVTADFLPDDTAAYETLTNASAGSITINKADATCTVTGYSVIYDGAEHIATGSCLGVGSSVLAGLDLSATTHTVIGTYNGDAWTFTDVSGNYNNTSGTVDNVISAFVDTTAPVVASVVRADADNTSASRVNFTVSFSEAVTGVDASAPYADFNLVTTGVGEAFITAVSGSGATYTVTVNTGVGSGTIRLDVVDDDSIIDAASNPLGGAFSAGQVYTIVKTPTFTDVPATNPYYQDIEILYANGLTAGCGTSPLRFCPDQTMNRGEAAVFMLRGNLGSSFAPDAATHIFKDDWTKGTWAEPWAEGMYKKGMSAGCSSSPLKYCPWDQIPREQAVIFALRLKYGMSYIPPAATGTLFADMTNPSYFATSWAEQAYKDGLIAACGTSGGKPLFCPKNLVSRGLAAQMIVKAKNLTMP